MLYQFTWIRFYTEKICLPKYWDPDLLLLTNVLVERFIIICLNSS